MKYLVKSRKSPSIIKLIDEAIDILVSLGIPIKGQTSRRLERMAMVFLAVAGVTEQWKQASAIHTLKTRDIIDFCNKYFEENISSGSYDDIRRKDLKLLVLAQIVINSADNPSAATNDPTRGYSLSNDLKKLLNVYGTREWDVLLEVYLANKVLLRDQLARERHLNKVPVTLSNGNTLELSSGNHNILQKRIVEEFLPIYGKDASILYLGDTTNKMLYVDHDTLNKLQFFELSHGRLPDVIAYDVKTNWLYLIEAVHSSGPISEIRLLELKKLTRNCTAEIIYITAFLDRTEFKKWVSEIAWETEVWIADNPEHLIHFNGHKFLGPYISIT